MKAARELTIEMQGEGMDIRGREWGDMAVELVTLPAGTVLGPMLEGALQLRYADGTEEIARRRLLPPAARTHRAHR